MSVDDTLDRRAVSHSSVPWRGAPVRPWSGSSPLRSPVQAPGCRGGPGGRDDRAGPGSHDAIPRYPFASSTIRDAHAS